jgi:predicted dehydrogenase
MTIQAPGTRVHRIGVIGTGKISDEHLRFLAGRTDCSIAGVCDLSPSLARYAATRFASTPFTDYRRMLAEAKPQVVHVLTPPHTHVSIVTDCLSAGAHVIVEKPVAPTSAEAERLWSLADRHGRRLVENHNYRFNTPIRQMQECVASGVIGEVREVEVRLCLSIRGKDGRYADENLPHPSHRLPAGVLHEFLTHMCYLTLLFSPEWGSVRAQWNNHGGGALFKYDDIDAVVLGGPTHARIRFSCAQSPDCFTVTVRGTNGWLETDLFQPHVAMSVPRPVGSQLSPLANQIIRGGALLRSGLTGFWNKVMQVTPYEGLHTFLDQTYAALLTGSEPPVSRQHSLSAARLLDALVAGAKAA